MTEPRVATFDDGPIECPLITRRSGEPVEISPALSCPDVGRACPHQDVYSSGLRLRASQTPYGTGDRRPHGVHIGDAGSGPGDPLPMRSRSSAMRDDAVRGARDFARLYAGRGSPLSPRMASRLWAAALTLAETYDDGRWHLLRRSLPPIVRRLADEAWMERSRCLLRDPGPPSGGRRLRRHPDDDLHGRGDGAAPRHRCGRGRDARRLHPERRRRRQVAPGDVGGLGGIASL